MTEPLLSAKRSMTYRVSIVPPNSDLERGYHTCTFVGMTPISEFVTVAIAALDIDDGFGLDVFRPSKRKELEGA